MPVFEYSALNLKGKTVKGILDADSVQAARQKLRSADIFPTDIKEAVHRKPAPTRFSLRRPFARVKPSQVAIMTRQLATLVGAGFPLVSAIDALLPQMDSNLFRKKMAHIKEAVVEGNSFAQALALYPETFSPVYINMVRAAETSGTLEIVLERLADIAEKQQALNNRIRTAMAYPVLMSFIGVAVLFFLLTYIVPSISSIFAEMDQVLPLPTRLLIFTSSLVKSYWWLFLLAIAGLVLAFKLIGRSAGGRFQIDRLKLVLPLSGPLLKKIAVARFARTLGSLLENGIPMLVALDIVKNIPGNVLLARVIESAAQGVGKGEPLAASLGASDVFPMLALQMVQVGEQSGSLEEMLYRVADVFDNEVETRMMRMTSLLEPLMILIMGGLVGFIVVSICLPIFEMNQLIR